MKKEETIEILIEGKIPTCYHQFRTLYYGSNHGIIESEYDVCFKCNAVRRYMDD